MVIPGQPRRMVTPELRFGLRLDLNITAPVVEKMKKCFINYIL